VVVTPTGEVVTSQPPPAKGEITGARPGPSYIWASGYWAFNDGRWFWVPGSWQERPQATAVWVPGHWDNAARGWLWTPGHWD